MIDPGRLRRALELRVDRMADGRLLVGDRVVDLDAPTPCVCPDATFRGTVRCKHVLRAELAVLPLDVLDALRQLVAPEAVALLPVQRRGALPRERLRCT